MNTTKYTEKQCTLNTLAEETGKDSKQLFWDYSTHDANNNIFKSKILPGEEQGILNNKTVFFSDFVFICFIQDRILCVALAALEFTL